MAYLRVLPAEDTETEVANFSSQAGAPVEGGGHQHIQKIFHPKFVLTTRIIGIKLEQRLREWSTNSWPNKRPIL